MTDTPALKAASARVCLFLSIQNRVRKGKKPPKERLPMDFCIYFSTEMYYNYLVKRGVIP